VHGSAEDVARERVGAQQVSGGRRLILERDQVELARRVVGRQERRGHAGQRERGERRSGG
jgi:hypothetical protein